MRNKLGISAVEQPKDTIPDLLVNNIPRSLIMGIEDALTVAAKHAHEATKDMYEGHFPHALGQSRHFYMNQAFYNSLLANDANPSPIQGNNVVTGRAGTFTLARFNTLHGDWARGKRSQMRRELSMANKAIELLIHPDLYSDYTTPTESVCFFVACFVDSLVQPESPVSIQIAVPDSHMKYWLFKEPIDLFVNRYDLGLDVQDDLVKPKLKTNVTKQDKDGTTS